MKRLSPRRSAARPQRGISLLVVTVLMLAIVLMTLTAFYVSKTQYKLVGNIQASELAFGQAESVSAAARAWVNVPANAKSGGFDTYATSTAHLYPSGKLAALSYVPASMTWSDSNSTVSGNGRYLIELLGRNIKKPGDSIAIKQKSTSCKSVDLFRVVAKADAGQSGSRIIETIEATDGC
jgi:Tfp pilus assembly protein PilX